MNSQGETKGEMKGETKGGTNVNNPRPEIPSDSPLVKNDPPIVLTLLATKLVYPVAADDSPPYELIAWWKFIFSYLDINQRDLLELRWMCRQFRCNP